MWKCNYDNFKRFRNGSTKATAIANALEILSGVSKPSTDTETTVVGNTNAQEAILATISGGKEITSAVLTASKNLQSVAQGFESVDKSVRDSLLGSIGPLK